MGKSLYITFRWIRRGNEQDLLIDNKKIKLDGVGPLQKFGFMVPWPSRGVVDRNRGSGPSWEE